MRSPWHKRALSCFLAFCLATALFPVTSSFAIEIRRTPNTSFKQTEAALNSFDEPKAPQEVLLREPLPKEDITEASDIKGTEVFHDRNSITYKTGQGEYTTRFFSDPLTFIDERGEEHDVDNSLVQTGDSYTNAANAYSVTLPRAGDALSIKNEGFTLKLTPLFGQLANSVVSDNAIRYNNIAEGVDLQYSVWGAALKEDIILNHPPADAHFSYALVAENISFTLADNVVCGYRTSEMRENRPKQDARPVFILTAPLMSDASGATSGDVTLSLDMAGTQTTLTVTPDASWLAAPERAFPVLIDPTYELDISNIEYGVVQRAGDDTYRTSAGPNTEHYGLAYLYAGFEDGSVVDTHNGYNNIVYGESMSYVKIKDVASFINRYFSALPAVAILSAKLYAWRYKGDSTARSVSAAMIAGAWTGDGARTWNNQPAYTRLSNAQDVSVNNAWVSWDITTAFINWRADPSKNYGIMLVGDTQNQSAVAFSGPNNTYGQHPLYFELSWTVPDAVDEDLPLDAPNVNLRPLTTKTVTGLQQVTGLFADGQVRPTLDVNYRLAAAASTIESGSYLAADYGRIFPNSDVFGSEVPYTLGYSGLFESNWQSKLFKTFVPNALYRVLATATDGTDTTDEGSSDPFIIYRFADADTLPYVANYYGVSVAQLEADNRPQDHLAFANNTFFIRNPNANATVPYTRPANPSLAQKRALIYASMGRNMPSEYDMEPVDMATGNYYMESTDATSTDYTTSFELTRSYNAMGPQTPGVFGIGWSFNYFEVLSGNSDGSFTYHRGDGKQLVFTKDGAGFLSPAGYHLDLAITTAADAADVTYTITDASGTVRRFDDYGLLKSVTTARGEITLIGYDSNYRITEITTASGKIYGITTNAKGQITNVVLPNGATLAYAYTDDFLTAFTTADGETISYAYNACGLLSQWTDGRGVCQVKNEYDAQARVIRQIDAAGGVSTVTYTEHDSTLIDALGNTTTYSFDALYRVIAREGARTEESRSYDANNQLVALSDAEAITTTYSYDAAGNIIGEVRGDGSYQELSYNADNKLISLRDFNGNITTKTYDTSGDLSQITYPDGTTNSYSYDAHGRVSLIVDGEGNTTTFAYSGTASMTTTDPLGNTTTCYYDAMGNLINEVDANGNEHKVSYSPGNKKLGSWKTGDITTENLFDRSGNGIATIDERGNRSDFTYDAQNNLTSATDATGATVRFTYDAQGHRLSQTDALGNMTVYAYDERGNLICTTDASGMTEYFVWDGQGRLVKTTDRRGGLSTYEYDAVLGLPVRITSPSGTEEFSYDAQGNVLSHRYADGTAEHFTYDARDRTATKTTAAGLIITYSYDANGRVRDTTDSQGRKERFIYDAAGNLTDATDSLGNTTHNSYDKVGNLISATSADGATMTYDYDSAGNLTQIIYPDATVEVFTWDAAGNLIAQRDRGSNTTSYAYDATGDLIAQTDALGGTLTYAYDAAGRLIKTTDELSQTTDYRYDALGRPITVTDALGNVSELSYDAAGNTTKIKGVDGALKLIDYDAAGRITKTTDAEGLEVIYIYDAFGRMESWSDNAGNTRAFAYDNAGRLIGEVDALGREKRFTYDVYGNITEQVDFNGDVTCSSYDAQDRLISQVSPDGRTTTYVWDVAGNLIQTSDDKGRTQSYGYDVFGQLVSATDVSGQVSTYAYDLSGNLICSTYADGSLTAASYDKLGRQVASTDANGNTTTYVYDASSRLLSTTAADASQIQYAWDAAGNLVAVCDAEGFVSTFTYDAAARLTAEISALGSQWSYTYDTQGNMLSATDPLGATTTFSYTLDGKLATKTAANGLVSSYSYDEVGRIVKLADSTGLFFEMAYDVYGNIIKETSSSGAVSTYTYDKAHRITTSTNPEGALTQNSYDSRGNLIEAARPGGGVYTYTYDESDRVITAASSLIAPVKLVYDERGRITQTVQKDKVQETIYDAAGNTIQTVDALGRSTTTAYDARNRPTTTTDAVGNSATVTYSLTGRIIAQTDRAGFTQAFSWDADGNLTSLADELGQETTYSHDAAGNLTRITDPSGRTARFSYDAQGNLTARSIGKATTRYTYDAAGNLLSVTSPVGKVERFEYDVASRLRARIREDGARIDYDYDRLDALVAKRYSTDEGDVTYAYDTAGNRLRMDDASGQSSYSYDVAGRLSSYTNAQGRTLSYAYDEYGRMARVTYADGRTVAYGYDLADNLISVADSATGTTTYSLDANDNITCIKRPSGLISTCTYDAKDQLLTLTNTKSGAVLSDFAYTYDGAGRIVSERATQDATETFRTFAYDTAGQLASIEEICGTSVTKTSYTYDLAGNRIATVKGDSNYACIYHYDEDGQLASSYDGQSGKTTLYSYDAAGNLITKDDGGSTLTYTYDIENRLKAVHQGGELLMAAAYDGDSNRIFAAFKTEVEVGYEYKGEADKTGQSGSPAGDAQVASEAEISPKDATADSSSDINTTADARKEEGNLFWLGFGSGIVAFANIVSVPFIAELQRWWSSLWEESLTQEAKPDASLQDAANLQSLKDAGLDDTDIATVLAPPVPADEADATLIPVLTDSFIATDYELTYYLNDITMQNIQVAQTHGEDGQLKDSYIYGSQRILADTQGGITETYLYDGRGSVIQTHDGAALTRSLAYDVYGKPTKGVAPFEALYAFNAEEYSAVTHLQYLRARYYAPEQAAFISKDSELGTLMRINSQNRFTFAEADPVNNFDPSGHAISNNVYERQMEQAGGINELYNFYVGNSLQTSLNRTNDAFASQLNYAKGVDYTSVYAINSIASISQQTAN